MLFCNSFIKVLLYSNIDQLYQQILSVSSQLRLSSSPCLGYDLCTHSLRVFGSCCASSTAFFQFVFLPFPHQYTSFYVIPSIDFIMVSPCLSYKILYVQLFLMKFRSRCSQAPFHTRCSFLFLDFILFGNGIFSIHLFAHVAPFVLVQKVRLNYQ